VDTVDGGNRFNLDIFRCWHILKQFLRRQVM